MRQPRSLPLRAQRTGRHLRWSHDRRATPLPAPPPPAVADLPPPQIWWHLAPDLQARLRQTLCQVLQEVIRDETHR